MACDCSDPVAMDASPADLGIDMTAKDATPDINLLDAEPIPDAEVRLQNWILSMVNVGDATEHLLTRISIADENYGARTTICEDVALPSDAPSPNIISSLTFNNGKLFATGKGVAEGDTLYLVDPCECSATTVGGYGYEAVAGITSNGEQDMFGVSGAQDVVFEIDSESAMTTLLAALGQDWGTVGLTWSGPAVDTLWGINGTTDQLVELSQTDGAELSIRQLDYDFGSVGIEYHPGVDKIFACSNSGELLVVNPNTGVVEVGPDLGIPQCNNLAAPFGTVACIL